MSMLSIYELNRGWGICGFASALGVMYQRDGRLGGVIDAAATKNQLNTRLLAEIKSYLVMLQAEGNQLLLNEIVRFTQSFGGPYRNFSIDAYIAKVNSIGTSPVNERDSGFSIAMPPNGVADYLRRVGGMKVVLVSGSSMSLNNVILGLGDKTKAGGEWKGLRHWVFKKNNSEIYNWGRKETHAQLMGHNANWQVVFQVAYG